MDAGKLKETCRLKYRDYFKNSSNNLKFEIRQTISVLATAYKSKYHEGVCIELNCIESSHVISWKRKRRNRSSLIKCSCYGRTYTVCVYPKRIS